MKACKNFEKLVFIKNDKYGFVSTNNNSTAIYKNIHRHRVFYTFSQSAIFHLQDINKIINKYGTDISLVLNFEYINFKNSDIEEILNQFLLLNIVDLWYTNSLLYDCSDQFKSFLIALISKQKYNLTRIKIKYKDYMVTDILFFQLIILIKLKKCVTTKID